MIQINLKGVLLLLLISSLTGCNFFHSANQKDTLPTKLSKPLVISTVTSTPSLELIPQPTEQSDEESSWQFADTHFHPYEGILIDFSIENNNLISLKFKLAAFLRTPTNPTSTSLEIGESVFVKVRNDLTESSKINSKQSKYLVKGAKYTIIIDDWRYEGIGFKGTCLSAIYYKKDTQYYSLKDNTLFNACGSEDCQRITK